MKNKILLILGLWSFSIALSAQSKSAGMQYQAIARDLDGKSIVDQEMEVKVEMILMDKFETVLYEEYHEIKSNKFGLINLTIGQGEDALGVFDEIPWSEQNIWTRISVKSAEATDFQIVSTNKLYSVPYAYYSEKSGSVVGEDGKQASKVSGASGGNVWSLKGNKNSDTHGEPPLMGTTDYNPISFITNDIERLRITEDGEILMNGNINVGGSATIQTDLIVHQNVYLNTLGGNTEIDGQTTIGGPDMNAAIFTGDVQIDKTLTVDGTTDLNSSLSVNNGSATDLSGTLTVTGTTDLDNTLSVDGTTDLNSSLSVNNGSATDLSGTLTVTGATDLDNTLTVDGTTDLNSSLSVNNGSATTLSGTLTVTGATDLDNTLAVDGTTDLNSSLSVNNGSATDLSGTLTVTGATDLDNTLTVDGTTDLNSSLSVNNGSATDLSGTLTVTGATDLDNTLTVDGATTINNTLVVSNNTTVNGVATINNQLNVTKDVADGSFLATMHNTNNGNGDGLKIKLGKNRTNLAPPALPALLTPGQVNDIKNLIRCDFPSGSKPQLLVNIVAEGLQADVEMIGGLAIGIGNLLINFINTEIGLPVDFPAVEMPAINFPAINTPSIVIDVPVIPTFTIPGAQITGGFNLFPATPILPSFEILPAIPTIDLSALGIPSIPINDLGFWGIPNICLNDGGTNPLNNENEFIRFSDNSDVKMGSIRAVSVSDWASDYLNPVFLFKLHGALTSAVDKNHARYHFKAEISAALKDYTSIGVEYSSGNGDYAEWLERADLEESISPGDIVAVKGGRISKDLENAEQVMVVSHNPIVLGNIPPDNKVHLGNNIAFMGQVPVKITGPVKTGDYIIANPTIPGYGFAKSQNDMTVEDFKYAVGRAWEEDLSAGPKMINTVVGIHNGDYFKVLKNYESKLQQLEENAKVTSENILNLESKVDEITKVLMKPLSTN